MLFFSIYCQQCDVCQWVSQHSIIREQMESSSEGFDNSKKKSYYGKLIVELLADIMQEKQPLGKCGIVVCGVCGGL